MCKFIEVNKWNGILYQDVGRAMCYEPRLINIDHIINVECRDDGKAVITLIGGGVICCKESYEEVKRKVLDD